MWVTTKGKRMPDSSMLLPNLIEIQKSLRKEADALIVGGIVTDTQKYEELVKEIQDLEARIRELL